MLNVYDLQCSSNTGPGTIQTVRSVGEGIEREVLCMAFEEYRSNPTQYMSPCLDETWSIITSPVAHLTSSVYRREILTFGALAALLMLNGIAPTPLDPVFLYWLINDCAFESITSAILHEWHPTFHAVMERWLSLTHTGIITDFSPYIAMYTDLDVSNCC